MPAKFAYYCSGHGYGHATRVSAFATSLLSLDEKPSVSVVSSAPPHIFSECIQHGAQYRNADVDPVIVQPLAYEVDRQKSLHALQTFLSKKEEKLSKEVAWLLSEEIDCVLSDAAFLACEAATRAGIPSILITNFTFDSVYSYLGTEHIDGFPNVLNDSLQVPEALFPVCDMDQDFPIPEQQLAPLVSQLLAGYRHADILLLLPGFIPIPSFFQLISLPAPAWVDSRTNRFKPGVESTLRALPNADCELVPSIPFPSTVTETALGTKPAKRASNKKPPRTVKLAPLLVRPVSAKIHTPEGRSALLSSIGIPEDFHDPERTKILVVSFGGQKIRRPLGGRSPSGAPSCQASSKDFLNRDISVSALQEELHRCVQHKTHSRTASTKFFIPGAPSPVNSPTFPDLESLPLGATEISLEVSVLPTYASRQEESNLLPSSSWIAIICGVSSNWSVSEGNEELPAGFYVAPSNVYMPDLTSVADVLMGKLGYGTVSECVAQSTPLVYGALYLVLALLNTFFNLTFTQYHAPCLWRNMGFGLSLKRKEWVSSYHISRGEYEAGAWANKVEEAYSKGRQRRRCRSTQRPRSDSTRKVQELARWVVNSVEEWSNKSSL